MPPNPMYYGAQVADLLRDQGRIRGGRELTRGATLASAFQAVPQALAGFVQARDARRVAAQAEAERVADQEWQTKTRGRTMADWGREDAVRDIAKNIPLGPDGQPDYTSIARAVGQIDPLAAQPYRQIAETELAKARKDAQERAETIARELRSTKDQASWDDAVQRLGTKNIRGVPAVFSIGARDSAVSQAMSFSEWLRMTEQQKPEPVKTREIKVTNPDGTEEISIVPDIPTTKPFVSTPTKPKVTFGQPQVQMVNGKRDLIRAGSDGKWYLPGSDTPFTGRVQPPAEKETGGITTAQKAEAERWRMAELRRLDEYQRAAKAGNTDAPFDAPGVDGNIIYFGSGTQKTPLTDAELKAARRAIENSYRKQLGEPLLPEPRAQDQPWAPPMRGGRVSTRLNPPIGPSSAIAAPTTIPSMARPTPSVTAPSTPTVQPATPSATMTGPTRTGPASLPSGTTSTVIQNGVTYRVTTDPQGRVISAVPVK